MFIPLHDGVPLRYMRAPYVTHVLIALCVLLYLLLTLRESETGQIAIAAGFGLIPPCCSERPSSLPNCCRRPPG